MTRLVFLPGMDGSVYIFSKLKRLLSAYSVTFVQYPNEITDEWFVGICRGTAHNILIGFSFGGVLARRFASKFPEQVAGLILINSAQSLAQLQHPLQSYVPILLRLPKSVLNALYALRLKKLLYNEGLTAAQVFHYLADVSDGHDILKRHQMLASIRLSPLHQKTVWLYGESSIEVAVQKDELLSLYPKDEVVMVTGGHRCLLTHTESIEAKIQRAINGFEMT